MDLSKQNCNSDFTPIAITPSTGIYNGNPIYDYKLKCLCNILSSHCLFASYSFPDEIANQISIISLTNQDSGIRINGNVPMKKTTFKIKVHLTGPSPPIELTATITVCGTEPLVCTPCQTEKVKYFTLAYKNLHSMVTKSDLD